MPCADSIMLSCCSPAMPCCGPNSAVRRLPHRRCSTSRADSRRRVTEAWCISSPTRCVLQPARARARQHLEPGDHALLPRHHPTSFFDHDPRGAEENLRRVTRLLARSPLVRQVDRLLRRGEHPPQHGLEEVERQRVVARIEAVLVVGGAEVRAGAPVRMVPVPVAQVPVESQVVEEVVALEDAVVLARSSGSPRTRTARR